MDPITRAMFMASASAGGGSSQPNIGDAYEGGFFAGYISQNADSVATHGLIVAPAASGYNGESTLQWKTSNTGETFTLSFFDGAHNTANMADTSHPAANYCAGLTIGGYSDWYMPAFAEIEIAYYNLKPTTTSNSSALSFNGINNYSIPARTTAWTSGTPAQTSVTAFQSGGTEAFLAARHWSSMKYSSARAMGIDFDDGNRVTNLVKTGSLNVRAFRKFAV